MTTQAAEIRGELETLLARDLLGPAGGDDEVLDGRQPVRDRYLTGMLAPKRTVAVDPERSDGAAVEGDDSSSEADIEDRNAAVPALFPSSYGMTVAVPLDVTAVRVEVWWGRYEKEEHGEQDAEPAGDTSPGGAAARPEARRVWQRYPIEASVEIPLDDEQIAPVAPVAEQPLVVISGRVKNTSSARLVTLFLTNTQPTLERNKDAAWLFQAGFAVSAIDGAAVFIGRREAVPDAGGFADASDSFAEMRHLDMLYRDHVEFAVGHGVAVHAQVAEDSPQRAVRIRTTAMPTYEVPRVEAPTAQEEPDLAAALVDMRELARAQDLRAALEPLVRAYERWIDAQEQRIGDPGARLGGHEDAVGVAIDDARDAARRIRDGIELVASDPDAREAFRFANEAMWQQRVRTAAALVQLDAAEASIEQADVLGNRSWRPFQIAFVLLNLPSLTDRTHRDRTSKPLADLLFFPTGGGKTEAYLGLCAYTLAIRRLQGVVDGRSGEGGVAVLMRYTLRLLTAQQFQRAAALVCACEVIRRRNVKSDPRWGQTPFRIALWVGSSLTQNRSRDAQRAVEDVRATGRARGAHPLQLSTCPWCARSIDAARDVKYDNDTWRTLVYCGNHDCEFSERNADREGLPVVTVDEDMYRLLPSLVIATADKFAQLPLKGEIRMLFGHVNRRCTRHGYRSPDLDRAKDRDERDSHRATRTLPAANTEDCPPLRPPDLIIQDELHLISGPLGTLVGLYETAIDELCTTGGSRPKVVASTATVRRAREQVWGIFWRDLEVFPPPVLDASDSFFSRQATDVPGRLYAGICAPGTRLKTVERRVFSAALASAQALYDRHGAAADPWMTLIGYFGALRELGGMRRIVEDEVRNDLRFGRRGLPRRQRLEVRELTSRVASSQIREVLDELAFRFDPDAGDKAPKPVDVVLATNMISVGVDVPRLGLMVCVGQPKATAEYIQATSRVGRSQEGPGVVLTIYNWARPRDLSHYETFEHYHATFYRQVEALSVTPFAARALDRGLTAVTVAMLRHGVDEWNGNPGANNFDKAHARVAEVEAAIVKRAEEVSGAFGDQVRTAVRERMDSWAVKRKQVSDSAALGYRPEASLAGLLETPSLGDWPLWAVPNSMRETEPLVNLIVDDSDPSLGTAPPFQLGAGEPSPERETAEDEEPEGELPG